jgi:hypothetical protein
MDVNEVVGLARWMAAHVTPAMSTYEELASAMEQNAGGSNKVPLRDHLDAVKLKLLAMPVEQLSYQQIDLLSSMAVEDLIGEKGWRFVERTVKEGNYDPASAATDIRRAKQKFDSTLLLFKQVRQSLKEIEIVGEPAFDSSNPFQRWRGNFEHNSIQKVDYRVVRDFKRAGYGCRGAPRRCRS